MNSSRHLSESERHDAADGVPAPDLSPDVAEHLGACEVCARDVARIKRLMTRIAEAPHAMDPGVDLWPEIRLRIEREKIIQLPSEPAAVVTRPVVRYVRWALVAAAAAVLVVALPLARSKGKAVQVQPTPVTNQELILAADSARAYEREATVLLNELELRRALLPPSRRTSIDRDLTIIDQAILELKDAIARDPNNPALRRLLASSYKQKVDLLKRATTG
jgi:hypothetical protein